MNYQEMTPQQRLVLDYLHGGHKLTNLVAVANLGVGSLSSRIAELRKMGYAIEDEVRKDHWGSTFKSYYMKKVAEAKSAEDPAT
jgi:hypothetical protein